MRTKLPWLARAGSVWSVAALVALSGCTGDGGGTDVVAAAGSGAGGSSSIPAGGAAGAASGAIAGLDCSKHVVDPGPSPMRLLSRAQYLATVEALAGDVAGLESALGPAEEASAFGLVQPDVTQVELEHFQKAADTIARSIVRDPVALNEIAPCAAGSAPVECARSAIQAFGARIYRAPITDPEDVARHLQLFEVGNATSFALGIELLLRGMLQAPRFLYRVEVGTIEQVSESAVKLSPYEVATRLSYTVWNTMPDERLTQAAASGGLATKQGVSEQLRWMIADPRGQKVLNRFLEGWTHIRNVDTLVKDAALYPEFQTPSFRAALKGQAAAFFDDLLNNQGGKLSALFLSTAVFINEDTAPLYGQATTSPTFQLLSRSGGEAAGVLTLPAVLAVTGKPLESSPIYRGRFVREALLCQQLPAPPANIPPAPEVTAGSSTRERLAQHEANPACVGCHQLLDPIGFGFESYDSIGRYRTEDGGKPVDDSGKLVGTRDQDGPFEGVVGLAQKLAQSQDVKECVLRQWFRFVTERFEQPLDGCSIKAMLTSFDASGQDLRSLPEAMLETDALLHRRPTGALVPP